MLLTLAPMNIFAADAESSVFSDMKDTDYYAQAATPSTTINANRNATKYNSIFNFANTSDFVTYVPLKEWNFGAFGVTRFMSIQGTAYPLYPINKPMTTVSGQ